MTDTTIMPTTGTTALLVTEEGYSTKYIVGWKYHFPRYEMREREYGLYESVLPHDEQLNGFFGDAKLDFPNATEYHITHNRKISEHARGWVFSGGNEIEGTTPLSTKFTTARQRRNQVENWAIENIFEKNLYAEWLWRQHVWSDPRIPSDLVIPNFIAMAAGAVSAASVFNNTFDDTLWGVIKTCMVSFEDFANRFKASTAANIHSQLNQMREGSLFKQLVDKNGRLSFRDAPTEIVLRPQFHKWRAKYFTQYHPTHMVYAYNQPKLHPSHPEFMTRT